MALKEITLPAMGEGIVDATIIRWLVKEGDTVKVDQPLVEIATDKVDSEIPSPIDGYLKKIIASEGSMPRVGEVIAVLSDSAESTESISEIKSYKQPETPNPTVFIEKEQDEEKILFDTKKTAEYDSTQLLQNRFIPPFLRLAAQQLNISLPELYTIYDNLNGNSLTKDILLQYAEQKKHTQKETTPAFKAEVNTIKPEPTTELLNIQGNYELETMSRMRKLIASHIIQSHQTIPHVTSFVEIDITEMVQWREKVKDEFYKLYKTKITLTPLFIEVAAMALKLYPGINASVNGDKVILYKDYNIGVATVLNDGNLIVPVIKNADRMTLTGIALTLNDLANRAREQKLVPAEITGSTFTITNIGVFGTLTGTPIINHPEAAILSIGSVIKKPYVVKTDVGNSIGIRDIVMLSLSYDHRIIDGGLAGNFLRYISNSLTNFNSNRPL
jgi:2-oxoglutarate dehydrogenase E2 component (dihydrolipoamide succinyltransferase)